MTGQCRGCGKEIGPEAGAAGGDIGGGICETCAANGATGKLLETIDAPVLLMQGEPRQVVTANRKALALFGKGLEAVEGFRGGQVFDCVHSFSEAGCGKDINCEDCPIKNAIVDTFATGTPHRAVAATLQVKKAGDTENRVVQVSTEKIGELALVRVERYDRYV